MKVTRKVASMAKAVFFLLLGIHATSEYDLNDIGLTENDIKKDLSALDFH